MYRIYQLEEVIHENLRPEKSQEVQKLGGKRKSYNQDPDDGEAPGDNATKKKSRRKRAKKESIEVLGRGVAEVEGLNVEADKGNNGRKDANLPTTGPPDGSAEGPKHQIKSTRGNIRKKEEPVVDVEDGEADVAKVAQKRKKRRIRANNF